MSLSFTCPRCRMLLKVRDESFVGTTLNCPDCQAPLVVALSATGEIIGQEILPERPTSAPTRPSASKNKSKSATKPNARPAEPDFVAPAAAGSRTPQIVAWIVAGICLLALIPFLIPSRGTNVGPPEHIQGPSHETVKKESEPHAVAKKNATQGDPAAPSPESPEARLKALGDLVLQQAKANGQFPSGTVSAADLNAAQRWSWLAQLAAKHDNPNATAVDWDQRWNDPVQDRFVRRPIPRFQNPQVTTIVSEDKYPATHFVGVAGVGSDAPTLPADHPRAGIFGQDRQTKLDQIKDGLSNTMLIAGVEDRLGSWAEGTSSYRPFTREPYVHGPDGFGTGQADRMFVLMADGSVREVNAKTDPRLVRRMAAMNDGFPLDLEVPGEPGDPRPGSVPIPDPLTAQVKPTEDPKPPAPAPEAVKPEVEPPKPIDIPAALSRKILKFEQTKPAAAFQLLLQIEELAGVRIEYDRKELGTAAERLDKQITLKRDNASLEELLDDVLKQIDLQRKSEATCIRIVDS